MDPTQHMLGLLSGYWPVQAIYVAAELGIADRLAEGPRPVAELAAESGADADALGRLLRGLTCSGIFEEVEPGVFGQTPLSATLQDDREHSLRPVALLGGHPLHWQAWGNLLHAVRTGETAFDAAHGQGLFDALAGDPALAAVFQRVLGRLAAVDASVLAGMDAARFARIVDVGGGSGAFASRIAREHPDASVVLFDRAEVIATARTDAGVDAIAGDFFAGVPPGADAYVLKFVLHDWDDERAAQILTRCREAMQGDATLLIAEAIVPDSGERSFAKSHDVNMLVLTGGRERTRAEYASLLEGCGFALERVTTTPSDVSVLEARPR